MTFSNMPIIYKIIQCNKNKSVINLLQPLSDKNTKKLTNLHPEMKPETQVSKVNASKKRDIISVWKRRQ